MARREKMICPDCEVEMNLHAEKIDQAREAEVEEGGTQGDVRVLEFHTCPACGQTLERREN